MYYCIGFLNDGYIIPLSQIVLTPYELSDNEGEREMEAMDRR
jgi:hypothetical protein